MTDPHLASVALRVHKADAMRAFYAEAFGASFEAVDVGPFQCQFGQIGGLTLKLVPLRDGADFEAYPLHQLGFAVDDVDRVIALAEQHGGRVEGEVNRQGDRVHACVRDPDGNTVELTAPR